MTLFNWNVYTSWEDCHVVKGDCNADQSCVLRFSNASNGHVSDCSYVYDPSGINYQYEYALCCTDPTTLCKVTGDPCNPSDPNNGGCCSTYDDGTQIVNLYCSQYDNNAQLIDNPHCCPDGTYWKQTDPQDPNVGSCINYASCRQTDPIWCNYDYSSNVLSPWWNADPDCFDQTRNDACCPADMIGDPYGDADQGAYHYWPIKVY